jgi:hypothetical protein
MSWELGLVIWLLFGGNMGLSMHKPACMSSFNMWYHSLTELNLRLHLQCTLRFSLGNLTRCPSRSLHRYVSLPLIRNAVLATPGSPFQEGSRNSECRLLSSWAQCCCKINGQIDVMHCKTLCLQFLLSLFGWISCQGSLWHGDVSDSFLHCIMEMSHMLRSSAWVVTSVFSPWCREVIKCTTSTTSTSSVKFREHWVSGSGRYPCSSRPRTVYWVSFLSTCSRTKLSGSNSDMCMLACPGY